MNIMLMAACLFISYRTFLYGRKVGEDGNKKGKYAVWFLMLFLLGSVIYLIWFKKGA